MPEIKKVFFKGELEFKKPIGDDKDGIVKQTLESLLLGTIRDIFKGVPAMPVEVKVEIDGVDYKQE